jgi:hypothetical protein
MLRVFSKETTTNKTGEVVAGPHGGRPLPSLWLGEYALLV